MKKLSVDRLSSWILFSFLILYTFIRPVFKYFEYAHGSIRINFSVIFALFTLVFVFFNYYYSSRKNKLIVYDSRTYILGASLLYIILIQIIQLPFILSDCESCFVTYLSITSSTIFSYILFFFLGFQIIAFFNDPQKRKLLFFSWLAYSSIVLINTGVGGTGSYRINLEGEQIYLMLADAYAFLSIIAVFFSRKFVFRSIIFLFSSFILFLLLSRTSLYLFVLIGVLLLFRTHPFKMSLLLLLLILGAAIVLDVNFLQFKENRMLRFILTGQDSSWSHRERLLREGYEPVGN